jgi:exodeoxyribonuclease-3
MAAHAMGDLLVITGVSSTQSGRAMVEALADHGYAHVVAREPAHPDHLVVLASHTAPLWPVPLDVARWPHRALGAVAMLNGRSLGLVGLHPPSPHRRRQQAPGEFRTAVASTLARPHEVFPDMPVVVAGDLAASSAEDTYDDPLHAAGLTDAYRHLHGRPPEPCGAPPRRGAPGAGRVFVTTTDAPHLVACEYDQQPVTAQLSDRSAVTLLLRLRRQDQSRTPESNPTAR